MTVQSGTIHFPVAVQAANSNVIYTTPSLPKGKYRILFGVQVENETQLGLQLEMRVQQSAVGDGEIDGKADGSGPTATANGGATFTEQQIWLSGNLVVKVPCAVELYATNPNQPVVPGTASPQEFISLSDSHGVTVWIVDTE